VGVVQVTGETRVLPGLIAQNRQASAAMKPVTLGSAELVGVSTNTRGGHGGDKQGPQVLGQLGGDRNQELAVLGVHQPD
jgi:hypothetical protein